MFDRVKPSYMAFIMLELEGDKPSRDRCPYLRGNPHMTFTEMGLEPWRLEQISQICGHTDYILQTERGEGGSK